jgi:hypothetical protein
LLTRELLLLVLLLLSLRLLVVQWPLLPQLTPCLWYLSSLLQLWNHSVARPLSLLALCFLLQSDPPLQALHLLGQHAASSHSAAVAAAVAASAGLAQLVQVGPTCR